MASADALQQGQFELVGFLLLGGVGLLELILQPIDPVQDHFQVGEQQLLAEAAQFIGQVAVGIAVEDDQQAAAIAENGQAARIVAAFADHQAGRVEKFELAGRGLLGMEMGREPVEPFIGHVGLADLSLLALGRVRFDAGEPVEDRALARTRETRDADSHG